MVDLDDPEFSQAKYASYRILCADLAPRLPRKHLRRGDVYMEAGQIRVSLGRMAPLHDRIVWLPSLADWLEMLEEAGMPDVAFSPNQDGSRMFAGNPHPSERGRRGIQLDPWGEGATREEAAARLWVAVIGH